MGRVWLCIILVLLLPISVRAVNYIDTVKVPNDASDCRTYDGSKSDVSDDISLLLWGESGEYAGYLRIVPPSTWWSPGNLSQDSTVLWLYCSNAGADSIYIHFLDTADCPVFEGTPPDGWNPYGYGYTGHWIKWTPSGTGTMTVEIDTLLQLWGNLSGASSGDGFGLELRGYGANDYKFDDLQKAGTNEGRLIFYFSGDSISDCNWVADTTCGYAPLSIQFTDSTDGSVLGWEWDFGDGKKAYIENPSHTFTTPGVYSVQLTTWDIWGDTLSKQRERYIAVSGGGVYFVPILSDADDAYMYQDGTEYTTATAMAWGGTHSVLLQGNYPFMRFWIDSTTIASSVDSMFLNAYTSSVYGNTMTDPHISNIDSANCSTIEGADFSAWAIQADSIAYGANTPWTSTGWHQHPEMSSLYSGWKALGGSDAGRWWGLRIYGKCKVDPAYLWDKQKDTANVYLEFYMAELQEDYQMTIVESLNNQIIISVNHIPYLTGSSIRYSLTGYPGKTGGSLGDTAYSHDDTIFTIKGLLPDSAYYFSLLAKTKWGDWVTDSLICHTLSTGSWAHSQDITVIYSGSDTLIGYVASVDLEPTNIWDAMLWSGLPKGTYFKDDTYERTYFIYVTGAESLKIGYYDHSSQAFSDFSTLSEALGQMHSVPAMTIDTLGYIWFTTGAHNSPVHLYRTKNPLGIDTLIQFWTDDTSTVEPGHGVIKGTYPSLQTRHSINRVEMFLRLGAGGVYESSWSHFWTVSGGTTFARDTVLDHGTYHYADPTYWANDTAGIIQWDEQGQVALHALFTCDSLNWMTASKSDTFQLPVDPTDATTKIYDYGYGIRQSFMFDDSLNPIFIFSKKKAPGSETDSALWIRLWYNGTACDTQTLFTTSNLRDAGPFWIEPNTVDSVWYCFKVSEGGPWLKKTPPQDCERRADLYEYHRFSLYRSDDSGVTWAEATDLARAFGLASPDPLGFYRMRAIENASSDGAIRFVTSRGWGKYTQAFLWPLNFIRSEKSFPYDLARADGKDIRIYDPNSKMIPCELDWENMGRSRLFWKVDTLHPNDTLTYTLKYGNPNAGDYCWPDSIYTWNSYDPVDWTMATRAGTLNVEGGVNFVTGEQIDAFAQREDTARAYDYIPGGIVRGWFYDVPGAEKDSAGHSFCVSVWGESTAVDTFSIRLYANTIANIYFQDKDTTITIKDATGDAVSPIEPRTNGWHYVEFRPDGEVTFDYIYTYQMATDTFYRVAVGQWDPLTKTTPHETYYAQFNASPFYADDSLIIVTLGDPPLTGFWVYNTGSDFGITEGNYNVTTEGDWLVLTSESDTGIFYTNIENVEWAIDAGDTNAQGNHNKMADLWKVSWDDSIPSGAAIQYYVTASDAQSDLLVPGSCTWTLVSSSEDDPGLDGFYQRGKIILKPSGGNGPIVYEFRGDYTVMDRSLYNSLKALRHGQWFDGGRKQPARW